MLECTAYLSGMNRNDLAHGLIGMRLRERVSAKVGERRMGKVGRGESFVIKAGGSADTKEEAARREKRKEKSEGDKRRGRESKGEEERKRKKGKEQEGKKEAAEISPSQQQ